MEDSMLQEDLLALTASIVSAYVSNNTVVAEKLPDLIASVHIALSNSESKGVVDTKKELVPAVSIKKSVTHDYIICLEDGKKFKSMKRHLRNTYNMSPEEYRDKWGLPHDYPIVAAGYSAARSQLAKNMGLGQRRK